MTDGPICCLTLLETSALCSPKETCLTSASKSNPTRCSAPRYCHQTSASDALLLSVLPFRFLTGSRKTVWLLQPSAAIFSCLVACRSARLHVWVWWRLSMSRSLPATLAWTPLRPTSSRFVSQAIHHTARILSRPRLGMVLFVQWSALVCFRLDCPSPDSVDYFPRQS